MVYGKLIDGVLIYAPSILTIDNRVHYHPTAQHYKYHEYLPIVNTPHPEISEDNDVMSYYISHWEIQNGHIVKVWTETEPPELEIPQPTLDERVGELENKVTSLIYKVDVVNSDQVAALNAIYEGVVE